MSPTIRTLLDASASAGAAWHACPDGISAAAVPTLAESEERNRVALVGARCSFGSGKSAAGDQHPTPDAD